MFIDLQWCCCCSGDGDDGGSGGGGFTWFGIRVIQALQEKFRSVLFEEVMAIYLL